MEPSETATKAQVERMENEQVPVVRFGQVSKRFDYSIEQQRTLLESLISKFSRGERGNKRELWALKDISFQVKAGECLGIIGRNGSGKSTILKLAAGIIQPTEGSIEVNGRLSALLELGAGFHQDLTGRENIFLNGSILGMSKREIEACYDQIVAFSELDEFIDMPVKHYSSGMYMRLGFSVAVHVDPRILIVDEVLAVGDQNFQDKCIERIFELKKDGTTIIFVSHNLDNVRKLSSQLLWLEKGVVCASGLPDEVIGSYLEHLHKAERIQGIDQSSGFRRWGGREIEITGVRILNGDDEEQNVFETGEALTLEIDYIARSEVKEPEFGIAIYRQDGLQVNGPNNRLAGLVIKKVKGPGQIRYQVGSLPLLASSYRVSVAVHDSKMPKAFDFHEQAYTFRVIDSGSYHQSGLVDIPARWEWIESGGRDEHGQPVLEAADQ